MGNKGKEFKNGLYFDGGEAEENRFDGFIQNHIMGKTIIQIEIYKDYIRIFVSDGACIEFNREVGISLYLKPENHIPISTVIQ